MITGKQKHYYAVVDSRGRLILDSGRLPIFWLRKVAKQFAEKFTKAEVKRIKIE